MLNVRLVLEYDGSRFSGWQMQPGQRTIQEELHRVLEVIVRRPIHTLYVSGRTDAGVHARGQVVNFLLDCAADEAPDLFRLGYSVSSLMRGEVAVVYADYVPLEFHARNSAESKQYSYRMVIRDAPAVLDYHRAWKLGPGLDLPLMAEEAKAIVGTHDFSSVRATDCSAKHAVREVLESEIVLDLPYVTYRVVGRGFLKQMVRSLVGTLVGIARGQMQNSSMAEILAAKDRQRGGITAPPYGLYLDWVAYPESFALDPNIAGARYFRR
jgi:tRNA pseudouridine38-40 synthase